jgi:WD40 repeat protein
VVLWNVQAATSTRRPLEEHRGPVAGLDFNETGDTLVSVDADGMLIVWDVNNRRVLGRPLQKSTEYVAQSGVALSPDGRTAATSLKGGLIALWDIDTWRLLGVPISGHPGNITAFAFSPTSNYLASVSLGGSVVLWDLRTQTWIDHARAIANRNLTTGEISIYLGR